MLTCLDIGGSHIKPGHSVSPGLVEAGKPFATPDSFPAFLAALQANVRPGSRGISISIAGAVDPENGCLKVANITALNGRPLAAEIQRHLGLPVWIANDADCFALAEAVSGAGVGHTNVFGIILGTGVGGGWVMRGRIITGAGGYAGEWGHGPVLNTRLPDLGLEIPYFACGCGLSGCVDTVGGARGMERLYRHMFGIDLASTAILSDWLSGEPAAQLVVEAWQDLVSGPLAMVLNVVGASIVPVGGGLSLVPQIVAVLDEAVRAKMLRNSGQALLVPSTHRIEPGLVGAMMLGWQGLGHG